MTPFRQIILCCLVALAGCAHEAKTPNGGSKAGGDAKGGLVSLTINSAKAGETPTLLVHVDAKVNEAFAVTEQLGTAQIQFSGTLQALSQQQYRLHYQFLQQSPTMNRQLSATIEVPLGSDKELGGFVTDDGKETLTLSVQPARP